MYERLFCWIVGRINDVIEVKNYDARVHGKNTVIGVLDIYGFEIFQNNRLEEHRTVASVVVSRGLSRSEVVLLPSVLQL